MRENAILGRVVFGTARGLFAHGTGCMSGIAGSPEALELRGGDGRRVCPDPDAPVLIRRPLRLSTGEFVDLIAVANGAGDLERRPGFIAYGFAVEYANEQSYRAAAEALGHEFRPAQDHYVAGLNFRENAKPFALPGEADRAFGSVSYTDPGRTTPIIRLTLADWWSSEKQALAIDALDIAAAWSGERAATIVISPEARDGSREVTSELLDQLAAEAQEKRELERRKAVQDIEALGEIHRHEDVVARRRTQYLEQRTVLLERRVVALEGEVRSARQHPMRSLMQSANGVVEDEEDLRRRRLLLASLALGAALLFLLVGLGVWFFSSGTDETAGDTREAISPAEAEPSIVEQILGRDGQTELKSEPETVIPEVDDVPLADQPQPGSERAGEQ